MFNLLGFLQTSIILIVLVALQPVQVVFALDPPITTPQILINEFQTASASSASEEFVELYNTSSLAVDVSGWKLEYKSATGTSWVAKAALGGQAQPNGFYLISTAGYLPEPNAEMSSGLAATGGHLRIVDSAGVQIDLVGWGSATGAEGGLAAIKPDSGQSSQRKVDNLGKIVDSQINLNDFIISLTPSPESTPQPPQEDEDPIDEPPISTISCEGIVISELLPNPSGSDAGQEFIELYNPTTEPINLKACGLQTSNSGKIFWFASDIELLPEDYKAFYDDLTDLNLPNSSGGKVYLLSPSLTELHMVTYEPDLEDDVAWAWFGNNSWKKTYSPSPNELNIDMPNKPCPAGQIRNPETNRCINKSTQNSTLVPCKPGQIRNAQTNRCRTIADAASALVPCKPDQTRNPETNRCRLNSSATANLKPCAEGQERNPATNRCRKIVGSGSSGISGVQDIQTQQTDIPTSWWLAGAATIFALGYGAWEWRHDIGGFIARLRNKNDISA